MLVGALMVVVAPPALVIAAVAVAPMLSELLTASNGRLPPPRPLVNVMTYGPPVGPATVTLFGPTSGMAITAACTCGAVALKGIAADWKTAGVLNPEYSACTCQEKLKNPLEAPARVTVCC